MITHESSHIGSSWGVESNGVAWSITCGMYLIKLHGTGHVSEVVPNGVHLRGGMV